MIKATCIRKNRDEKGIIIDYVLQDEGGHIINATSQQIKDAINEGKLTVTNLQIDKAGRLVDKAVPKQKFKQSVNVNKYPTLKESDILAENKEKTIKKYKDKKVNVYDIATKKLVTVVLKNVTDNYFGAKYTTLKVYAKGYKYSAYFAYIDRQGNEAMELMFGAPKEIVEKYEKENRKTVCINTKEGIKVSINNLQIDKAGSLIDKKVAVEDYTSKRSRVVQLYKAMEKIIIAQIKEMNYFKVLYQESKVEDIFSLTDDRKKQLKTLYKQYGALTTNNHNDLLNMFEGVLEKINKQGYKYYRLWIGTVYEIDTAHYFFYKSNKRKVNAYEVVKSCAKCFRYDYDKRLIHIESKE